MPEAPFPSALANSEDATRVFLELFKDHGLPCQMRDGWITANSGCLSAQARVYLEKPSTNYSAQLDLEVRTPDGHSIFESCAGFGSTVHEAIREAIEGCCQGPFHIIYAALTGQSCSHIDVEDWVIAGRLHRVYLGSIVLRGMQGQDLPCVEWFRKIEQGVKAIDLRKGLNWLRFYHCNWPGAEAATNEALLNNEHHPGLFQSLISFSWPPPPQFYSARLFMIVTDAFDKIENPVSLSK